MAVKPMAQAAERVDQAQVLRDQDVVKAKDEVGEAQVKLPLPVLKLHHRNRHRMRQDHRDWKNQ